MQQLVKQKFTYQAHFPLMITVVEALLVIPVSNAWPERGTSKVKLIKNRLRSLLKGDMLNSLLHISLNGPRVTSDDGKQVIKESVVSWLAEKTVRNFVDAVAGRSGIFMSQPKLAEHSTNTHGTQTLDEVPNEQKQVDEEVSLAAEKLGLPDDGGDDNESEEYDYYIDFKEGN